MIDWWISVILLSLVRGGNTLKTVWTRRSPCVPLTLCFSCAVTYKSLVVLSYFLSLVFFCCCFFMCLLSFALWVSSTTWSTPKGPWQLRKFTSCFSLLLYHWHPIIVSRSLSLLFLSWLPLSVTATQWQNRTLAVGAGLPVLAPPPLLPVPPPSL